MKLCSSIIAICTLLGMAFGVYFYAEARYALAQQLKEVESRLEYKIKSDQVKEIRSRIWQLEKECKVKCAPAVQSELQMLNGDLDDTKKQLRIMEKK